MKLSKECQGPDSNSKSTAIMNKDFTGKTVSVEAQKSAFP